jgi:hypothetical protein
MGLIKLLATKLLLTKMSLTKLLSQMCWKFEISKLSIPAAQKMRNISIKSQKMDK